MADTDNTYALCTDKPLTSRHEDVKSMSAHFASASDQQHSTCVEEIGIASMTGEGTGTCGLPHLKDPIRGRPPPPGNRLGEGGYHQLPRQQASCALASNVMLAWRPVLVAFSLWAMQSLPSSILERPGFRYTKDKGVLLDDKRQKQPEAEALPLFELGMKDRFCAVLLPTPRRRPIVLLPQRSESPGIRG
ncbi:hypothetical protein P154DRAFT_580173 [Amniculicola lignicola CBS 123094]|uniref:Uncharacterized protein n=1 Tax=Amniculicola lignicola CBS 123094 TaxID=1392246 RepID=A0A6A5W4T8_9PLEO|nr:hypothetical protein P154DRAFT_580173 [Amniculicola lignicola CBS 123094]